MGFILRNSGVLFDTPISKFWTNSTLTPVYSAAISALKPFLFVLPACKIYKTNAAESPQSYSHCIIRSQPFSAIHQPLQAKGHKVPHSNNIFSNGSTSTRKRINFITILSSQPTDSIS